MNCRLDDQLKYSRTCRSVLIVQLETFVLFYNQFEDHNTTQHNTTQHNKTQGITAQQHCTANTDRQLLT